MKSIFKNRFLNKEFLGFCVVGFLGFFFDYGFFKLFFKLFKNNIYFVKVISTFFAITLTFFLNKFFTFKTYLGQLKYKRNKEYIIYFLIQSIGGIINIFSFSLLIFIYPELRNAPFLPIALSAFFVAFLNFIILKLLVYKRF
jgi:putative flippase GtrA